MLLPRLLPYRSSLVKSQISIRTLATSSQAPSPNNARWLSETKTRLGRLFFHGATTEEVNEASNILKDLSKNWREYVAASEGFLTGEKWRGLYRHCVVWGDMDSMHHDPTNLKAWSELWTPRGTGLILRSIKVDYKFPIEWPDKVSVYHKLGTTSKDSFTLDVIILSEKHQRPAARCLEDIVVYNYQPADKTQRPGKAPIPDFVKAQFNNISMLQKEAREDSLDAIRDITEKVNALERRVLSRKEVA